MTRQRGAEMGVGDRGRGGGWTFASWGREGMMKLASERG